MSKHTDIIYFCDFCGKLCKTRRVNISCHKHVPAHLCVVTNDNADSNLNYILDVCEECVKKLARVPLQAKPMEENK